MKRAMVRLSQCMIVKNEEKNIRQALSWGKGIVCEQIVVDTGSTDDTVKIATELGATVYHFEWINDFSAAKNFAIEKATGNWIAFLDADESLAEEDVKRLMAILESMQHSNTPYLIRGKIANLDSKGKAISITLQERFFRNQGKIRYRNRIHEELYSTDGAQLMIYDAQDQIMIQHTGYSNEAYETTGKLERNIQLLEAELEQDPSNGKLMAYLADSLAASQRFEEACVYYQKVLDSDEVTAADCKVKSAIHMMQILAAERVAYEEETFKELYLTVKELSPEHPDANFYTAQRMVTLNKTDEAISHFEIALKKLDNYTGSELVYTVLFLEKIYIRLAKAYYEREEYQKVIHYGVLALRINPYEDGILGTILLLFKKEPGQADNPSATYEFLSKIYDFGKQKDQLFVYKCARIASFYALEDLLFGLFSADVKERLKDLKQSFIPVGTHTPYFTISNHMDAKYEEWIKEMSTYSFEGLLTVQKEQLDQLKLTFEQAYETFVSYFDRFSYWGTLDPEKEDYQVLEHRTLALTKDLDQFAWLYGQLADYRSKTVLYSIMRNWTYMDCQCLGAVKTTSHAPYFDLDLIPSGVEEVFVDVGAYNGDTVTKFIDTYGNNYKHIYGYEITPDSLEALKRNTQYYDHITIVEKGIGKESGSLYLEANEKDPSSNTLKTEGSVLVNVTSIDEDIEQPVTFIKMNIEGGERDALLGCRNTIQKHHPKLAVSVHYGYEDLWKIPKMIQEMDPSYQFYLRYYGGNLIPSEIVLYAL